MSERECPYPHNTVCVGCHACQPERFPNVSAVVCNCRVCDPLGSGREVLVRSTGHMLGVSPEAIERAVVVAERMTVQDQLVAVAVAARAYVEGSPTDDAALFDALREAVEELDTPSVAGTDTA